MIWIMSVASERVGPFAYFGRQRGPGQGWSAVQRMWPGVQTRASQSSTGAARRTALRLAAAGGQLYRRCNRGLALQGAARGGSWSLAWLVSTPTTAAAAQHCHMWHKAAATTPAALRPSWVPHWPPHSIGQSAALPTLFRHFLNFKRSLTLNLNSSD